MTLPVLICDDSSLARRQMARSLPENWDIDVSFAQNGVEAIAAIRSGKADLLFLDLNMPVMSGYEVLQTIRTEDLQTMVVVVSGDIQADARARVLALGALDFLRKPVSARQLTSVLRKFGIWSDNAAIPGTIRSLTVPNVTADGFQEALQEVINVAMGQAGSHLSEMLKVFIQLPVPSVFVTPFQDITRHLPFADGPGMSAVSHGFSGNGVAGEGIVLIRSDSFADLAQRMTHYMPDGGNSVTGILTDLSELLVGACLKGVSQQLDIEFNHSYPALLGHEQKCTGLLDCDGMTQEVLAISISYHLTTLETDCHLLLLFTEDSIPALRTRVTFLLHEITGNSP